MKAKITPFLLFNTEAEDAAKFYVNVFNGTLLNVDHYPEGSPMPTGTVLAATFEILGTTMTALNWGKTATFKETISFSIEPDTQEEVDYYWNALIADSGEESMCGWLKDKYGISWQVTPEILPRLMSDPNPEKSTAVMKAMMTMAKINIDAIQRAYDNA